MNDAFTREELTVLFRKSNWPRQDARDFYHLSYVAGLSIEELENLEWKDVDIAESAITVPDERKKIRLVPVNAVARPILQGIPKTRGKLFPDCSSFPAEFARALENSGIDAAGRDLGPGSIRAAFIALLREQGLDDERIARVYGPV